MTLQLRDEEAILQMSGSDSATFYRDALQPFKLGGYVEYQRHRTAVSDLHVLACTAAAVLRLPGSMPSVDAVFKKIEKSRSTA